VSIFGTGSVWNPAEFQVSNRIELIRREKMKKKLALIIFGLNLVFAGATRAEAQVKRVQMHIAGYLCGN
jgi:hypothetical protein